MTLQFTTLSLNVCFFYCFLQNTQLHQYKLLLWFSLSEDNKFVFYCGFLSWQNFCANFENALHSLINSHFSLEYLHDFYIQLSTTGHHLIISLKLFLAVFGGPPCLVLILWFSHKSARQLNLGKSNTRYTFLWLILFQWDEQQFFFKGCWPVPLSKFIKFEHHSIIITSLNVMLVVF